MKYGDIYKEITATSSLPSTVEEIWNNVTKDKKRSKLTIKEGSIFSHKSYNTDIDLHLN